MPYKVHSHLRIQEMFHSGKKQTNKGMTLSINDTKACCKKLLDFPTRADVRGFIYNDAQHPHYNNGVVRLYCFFLVSLFISHNTQLLQWQQILPDLLRLKQNENRKDCLRIRVKSSCNLQSEQINFGLQDILQWTRNTV